MINHGEFKSVRTTTNHLEATDQGQQDYDGPAQCAEPSESKTATRRATSLAGAARTLPRPMTPAERAEQRLGFAMMEESFNNERIPKPIHWIKAQGKAKELRSIQVAKRRAKVRAYAEEGNLTVFEVASILKTAVTTIRTDMQVLRVKLLAVSQTPSPFQVQAAFRRTKVADMAPTGMTKAEAARQLCVSEATVRRDIKIAGIDWLGE
jgi:DNA-binding NarL/FixJ family response regulator